LKKKKYSYVYLPSSFQNYFGFCKHILFVLLNYYSLSVDEPLLNQRTLTEMQLIQLHRKIQQGKQQAQQQQEQQQQQQQQQHSVQTQQRSHATSLADSVQNSSSEEQENVDLLRPNQLHVPLIDNRRQTPELLRGFKTGTVTASGARQEFLCRDCKRPFFRQGDRDNHENLSGHVQWRKGVKRQLEFA
jgi:transcription initiation factor TFIID subunit TAF12